MKESAIEKYHKYGDLQWHGCYSEGRYSQYVTEESMVHPAKASMALMDRIFEHLEQYELIDHSSLILDPMAGTGRTNIVASLRGYSSVAIELEKKFADLIEGNIKLFHDVVGRKANISVINGDARDIKTLIKTKMAGITSPPYAEAIANKNRVAGGGIAKREFEKGNKKHFSVTMDGYSDNKANIGNLKDGGMTAITSPPYGFDASGTGITSKNNKSYDEKNPNYAMKGYDGGEKNIGNYSNQSYQEAMLDVYGGMYEAEVSPVVTITKNPTKNKEIKRLDIETIELLEEAGYDIADYHQSMLWEEITQETLDGKSFNEYTGRLSFFKRLSLEKGNVAARWEDIIIATRKG